jgi:hypothetical protein
LSVRDVGRRTQPISKLLNDLLITSALNPTCLLQSALNPTYLLPTNSNSLLPNTASIDIQQHVNRGNSGDVDIRNLTVTLIRRFVLQRLWYQMPGCSVQ